jgi:hypothetical protein
MIRSVYEGAAAQPMGRILDLLGATNLRGVADSFVTPDTGTRRGELPSAPSAGIKTPRAFADAFGKGRAYELLGANDWALSDDLSRVISEGVSDMSRGYGGANRAKVAWRDVVSWLQSDDALRASDDADWPALVQEARALLQSGGKP